MTDMPDPVKVAAGVNEDDAMKMANDLYYKENPGQTRRAGSYEGCIIASAATLGARAMQDAMAGRVRVKALEWEQAGNRHIRKSVYLTTWQARTPVGDYVIRYVEWCETPAHPYPKLEPFVPYWRTDSDVHHPTFESAQVEVWERHERRILSSIEPAGAQEGADEIQRLALRLSEISPDSGVLFEGPGYEVRLNWLTEPADAKDVHTAHTTAPTISDELIDTARSHAIHDAMQSGMSRAEAEDHFGKPTPAPDVPGLVSLGHVVTYNDGRYAFFPPGEPVVLGQGHGSVAWVTDGDIAADALEALQAEVARRDCETAAKDLRIAELERGAYQGAYHAGYHAQIVDTDREGVIGDAEARATAAEAERDALRAEVERLRVIVGRFCQANDEGKLCDDTDNDGSHYPSQFLDDTLSMAAAALSPAKAGG